MITTIPPDDDWPGDEDLPPPPPNPDDGKPGRPPKFRPAMIPVICALLIQGNYLSDAAGRIGVKPKTLSRWLKLGRQFPQGVYGQLSEQVGVAQKQFITQSVGEIMSSGEPALVMEFLGRRYPRKFGRHRGELGDLKRLLKASEKEISELRAMVADLRSLLGAEDGRLAAETAG